MPKLLTIERIVRKTILVDDATYESLPTTEPQRSRKLDKISRSPAVHLEYAFDLVLTEEAR